MSRRWLLDVGVGPSAIGRAVRDGTLRPLARGIYRTGPDADLLRLGSELGWLSHDSAAEVFGLALPTSRSIVDVTVPHRRGASPAWAHLHRARLGIDDVASAGGLRATSVLRTLLDLARSTPWQQAVVATDSALYQRLVLPEELSAAAAASRGPGATRIRAVVAASDPSSESPLETMLRLVMASAGLHPRPQVAIQDSAGFIARVDFLFADEGVVVEADGFAFHADRDSFRSDRRRGNALLALGYRVLRFSWEDVVQRPQATVATIRRTVSPLGAERNGTRKTARKPAGRDA